MKSASKKRKCRQWTEEEDLRLLQQVNVYPHKLSYSFLVVAEVLDRTPGAIRQRWYSKVSKYPDNQMSFCSFPKSLGKNKKKSNALINIVQRLWKKVF